MKKEFKNLIFLFSIFLFLFLASSIKATICCCYENEQGQCVECETFSGNSCPDTVVCNWRSGSCENETNCSDGRDNDGDGLVDCADPNCNGQYCGYTQISCNPYCSGNSRCVYPSSYAVCNRYCSSGSCASCTPNCGTPTCTSCDDGNPSTIDSCTPEGCLHNPVCSSSQCRTLNGDCIDSDNWGNGMENSGPCTNEYCFNGNWYSASCFMMGDGVQGFEEECNPDSWGNPYYTIPWNTPGSCADGACYGVKVCMAFPPGSPSCVAQLSITISGQGNCSVTATFLARNCNGSSWQIKDNAGNTKCSGTVSSNSYSYTCSSWNVATGNYTYRLYIGGSEKDSQSVSCNAPTLYTLSVSKSGNGSGTVTGSGINCGTDCSESYSAGTQVTLTATPLSGSTFAGWSGDCSGTGSCTLTMNSNKSVTATFEISNQPPTAQFSCQIIDCGGPGCQCNGNWVTYNGDGVLYRINNNSTDSDNNIVKSIWSIVGYQDPYFSCPPFSPILCNMTLPKIPAGNYTIKLKVEDEGGLSSEVSHSIQVKQDIIPDFQCSLNGQEWVSCQNFSLFTDQMVYVKDISFPSQDAVINSRTWKKGDGVNFQIFAQNEIIATTTLNTTNKVIRLEVSDSGGRSGIKDYSLKVTYPLPKWKEIPPFSWFEKFLAALYEFFKF